MVLLGLVEPVLGSAFTGLFFDNFSAFWSSSLPKLQIKPGIWQRKAKLWPYINTRGPWTATPALIKVEEREQNKKTFVF